MAVFKCKMCGGTLEINNETVAVCQYCGTKQTLPKLDDDRKANLYDRANHFRRNNEFDKAMGIYEQILNDDNTDAETYWSLVLCRYGIEYVEDPSSRKRIPTVNRAQFTSIFDDEDYKSALQYADGYQKDIYEQEATAINDIQKGILAISSQEEPFDVFICYKESDNSGRRTPDSVLATELYHELTREGYKVFFSRITLEDKLGTAYEPYIFAALNSAKVMVVLGTKPEFFNAVWVKNEWSRYLALIKNGARKMLIPAYKDMDPYDLPEEFSHLQAQDMSKLGFMQDLIRGIKKIVESDNTKQTIRETIIANDNAGGNVNALLKRGFMALEDGEWTKADDFFEQCLNQNAELAKAYLGKLMAELQIKNQESLKNCSKPFDNNSNYQKIVRFGDVKLKTLLADTIQLINSRNKIASMEEVYNRACDLIKLHQESAYNEAKNHFESISGYKDADALADECSRKIAELKQLEEQKKAEEAAEAEKIRLEKERQTELNRIDAEKRANRNKKIVIIATPIVCVVITFIIILNTVIIPNNKYNDAIALMDAGKYSEAITAFELLDGYKESQNKITECKYNSAVILINMDKYDKVLPLLKEIDKTKENTKNIIESKEKLKEASYNKAIALIEGGNLDTAIPILETITNYKDSANLLKDANYTVAVKEFENILFGENNIDKTIKEVVEVFKEDYEYRDSSKYITYYKGITTDKIDNALKHFESLPKDFYDTQKRIDFIKQVNKLCGKYTNFNVIEKSQYGSNYKVYDLETSIQETDKQSANTIWVCINGKYSTSGENGWDDFFVNFKFDFNDYAQTGEISLVHQRVYNFNDLYITLIKNGFKFHSNTEDKFNVHREYYTCYTYKK